MALLFLLLALFSPVQEDYAFFTIPDGGNGEIPLRYYSPPFSGAPTIVIAHGWAETMEYWHPVASKFRELGFGVIIFSFPGHEEGNMDKYRHSEADIANYHSSLETVYQYALGRSTVVHLLGSGMGANLAILFSEANDLQGRLVAVSPGINYRGLEISPDVAMKVAAKIMLTASQEDTYSAFSVRTMRKLYEKLPEENRPPVILYSNVGHGIWLLKRLPESIASITRWFSEYKLN